jgi:hypothetical protein
VMKAKSIGSQHPSFLIPSLNSASISECVAVIFVRVYGNRLALEDENMLRRNVTATTAATSLEADNIQTILK